MLHSLTVHSNCMHKRDKEVVVWALDKRPPIVSGVALTQMRSVRIKKKLHAKSWKWCIHAVYAKSGTRSQHVSNYTWGKRSRKAREYCERKARIVCEQHFSISLYRVSDKRCFWNAPFIFRYFVGTHFRIFVAYFSSTCVRCTHLLKS